MAAAQSKSIEEAIDLSWIDMNAADLKHHKAAHRNARLSPIWTRAEHIEMDGLFARGFLIKRNRRDLPADARIIGSRYVYKFNRHHSGRHRNKVKRCKVRLVVQGQHMSKEKGNFVNAFAPVAHLSCVRAVQSIATAKGWFVQFAATYESSRRAPGAPPSAAAPASPDCWCCLPCRSGAHPRLASAAAFWPSQLGDASARLCLCLAGLINCAGILCCNDDSKGTLSCKLNDDPITETV